MSPFITPSVQVSWGELLDKLVILEIKRDRIGGAQAHANVDKEHRLLNDIAADVLLLEPVAELFGKLRRINEALWEIEDAIREQEADARFGTRFVALARSVYKTNDERAAIKRQINELLNSELIEEKSYAGADTALTLTAESAD
jgi:putative NIF3 family GTP cyclohydrolase 1 type 2